MPSRTGTASQVNGSAGNGSTTVTVPADCNLVVAFWNHWDGNASSTMSSLTLNSVGFTIQEQLAEGATADEVGTGVATLVNPATGSQTFAWTWSAGGARSEGGGIILVYVTGANTADPVRDTATDAQTLLSAVSVTLTTTTSDLVLAACQKLVDANHPVLDGTVFVNDWVVNNEENEASEVTPGATSVTINMTNENYGSMAAISLKPAAATKSKPFLRSSPRFTSGSF